MPNTMIENRLKQYAKLVEKLEHMKNELGIDKLEEKLNALSAEIKEEVRQFGESVEAAGYAATYSAPFRKWYDWSVIQKLATPAERKIIEADATTHEVSRERFDALVDAGKVRKELKVKAFREEAMTPRVILGKIYGKEKDQA